VPAPPRKKPLITANQLTIARLALLPLGSWLLYQGEHGQHIALYFMTLVGCTDFVDGYLARRYGATVLGGLMDPIADKVFIAAVFLPMIDLQWLPMPLILLVFLREFVITAARTTYSRRNVQLKTSYLAKIKTWYQMITSGLLFLLRVYPPAVRWIAVAMFFGPGLLGLIITYVRKREIWKGGVAFMVSFAGFYAVTYVTTVEQLSVGLGWAVVAITWASGGAYLFGLRQLAGRPLDAHDLVRLFGAVALPTLTCLLMVTGQAPSWALIVTVSLEFAVGGLDNLLAHHELLTTWYGWGARVLSQAALLGGALYLAHRQDAPGLVALLVYAALAVTAISVGIAFGRSRHVYLGERANRPSRA
jgi:CDP-diacylglycerol--glycerol-3-phosphate 3-phosphatidyltransferase